MQRILRRASGSKLPLVGSYQVGSTVYGIAFDKGRVVGLVDGYRVAETQQQAQSAGHVPTVLALMASRAASLQSSAVRICPDSWAAVGCRQQPPVAVSDILEATLVTLKDALGESAIVSGPEEGEGCKPQTARRVQLDLPALSRNLTRYTGKMSDCMRYSDRMLDRARVLLSRKAPPTMWGAADLQKRLDDAACAVQVLKEQLPARSREALLCRKAAEALSLRAAEGALPCKAGSPLHLPLSCSEHSKYAQRILIPDVLVYHARLSTYFGELVAATSTLLNLDRVVRRITGYPASFMFSSSMQEDFSEAASVLVKFLTDIPSMERAIFEPLEYIQHAPLSP